MNIIEFIKEHNKKKAVIYGAGQKGQALKKFFCGLNINIECFLVTKSNGNEFIDYIPICKFAKWNENKERNNYVVYVAVSDSYKDEIRTLLDESLLCYYCLADEDYLLLQRLFKPVNCGSFLLNKEPVSYIFGFDRGCPIDRYYIELFLRNRLENGIKDCVRVLEVGEDVYSKRYFDGERKIIDVLDYKTGMDLTDTKTLMHNTYDYFIATQVFNFIYDIKKAIEGAYYLLKNGGVMLATVAGNIGQISWADMNDYGDYWRFTDLSIKRLVQESFGQDIEVETFGNVAAATAFIQGLSVEDLPDKSILNHKDRGYSILIGICAVKKCKGV